MHWHCTVSYDAFFCFEPLDTRQISQRNLRCTAHIMMIKRNAGILCFVRNTLVRNKLLSSFLQYFTIQYLNTFEFYIYRYKEI